MESEQQVESRVEGIVTVITIRRPEALNAMDYYHYAALEEHVARAAENPHTIVTLIQSTGRYFSAGADVRASANLMARDSDAKRGDIDWKARRQLQGSFAGRNATISDTFWSHPKVLVVALNGPVVGLSASLVALADFVYARESAFLLVPFANLSLVTEGGAAFTLPARLGWSLANEALLACRPITATEMYRVGFVNKLFPASLDTDEFNRQSLQLVSQRFEMLDFESVTRIKALTRGPLDHAFHSTNSKEVVGGLERFSRGLPQERFMKLASKSHKHKL